MVVALTGEAMGSDMRSWFGDFKLRALLCILFALALLGCGSATQQITRAPTPAESPATTSTIESVQQRTPDVINRPTSNPYTGDLSIFEDPKRDQRLQVNRVMDILGIKEGSTVADIGAGSGWFTVRAARRVGSSGVVYAVDINREYLDYLEKRAKRESLTNIHIILGKDDDPLLPDKGVDTVLLLKTYHEVAQPIRLLQRTRESMRPGGLLGVIDRKGNGDDHGINADVVIREAERAGFAIVGQYDFVKSDDVDYFLVFRAK